MWLKFYVLYLRILADVFFPVFCVSVIIAVAAATEEAGNSTAAGTMAVIAVLFFGLHVVSGRALSRLLPAVPVSNSGEHKPAKLLDTCMVVGLSVLMYATAAVIFMLIKAPPDESNFRALPYMLIVVALLSAPFVATWAGLKHYTELRKTDSPDSHE